MTVMLNSVWPYIQGSPSFIPIVYSHKHGRPHFILHSILLRDLPFTFWFSPRHCKSCLNRCGLLCRPFSYPCLWELGLLACGWPWISDFPISTSSVLRSQGCIITFLGGGGGGGQFHYVTQASLELTANLLPVLRSRLQVSAPLPGFYLFYV